MSKFALTRTTQCAKCPWKVNVNPRDIPDGYCEIKHKKLDSTIAKNSEFEAKQSLTVMVCHHSKPNKMQHCVGWLHNQLGVGNNIPLRLHIRHCTNISELRIVGKQHLTFEDTLPK
jgi:hypothetical protein